MPGIISGITTFHIAYSLDAPRSSAASYVLMLSCKTFGQTDKTTYGIISVICATIIVEKLSSVNLVNRSISAIPVTTSAFNIGIFVTPIIAERTFLLMPIIPIQTSVPKIVAIKPAAAARITVV